MTGRHLFVPQQLPEAYLQLIGVSSTASDFEALNSIISTCRYWILRRRPAGLGRRESGNFVQSLVSYKVLQL